MYKAYLKPVATTAIVTTRFIPGIPTFNRWPGGWINIYKTERRTSIFQNLPVTVSGASTKNWKRSLGW